MKFLTVGNVSSGYCLDGEIGSKDRTIVITAKTKKDLRQKVKDATEEHSKPGSSLDFGMREPDTTVQWSGNVWKLVKDGPDASITTN